MAAGIGRSLPIPSQSNAGDVWILQTAAENVAHMHDGNGWVVLLKSGMLTSVTLNNLVSPTIITPLLTSPIITGATMSTSIIASPTITGTVAGIATYTSPTLSSPIIAAGTPTAPAGALGYSGGFLTLADGATNHVLVDLDDTQFITGQKIFSVVQLKQVLANYSLNAISGAVPSTSWIAQGDATGGAISITLPASGGGGRVITIQKIDSSGNAVTIARAGSDTINGGTTISLAAQYNSRTLYDGGIGKWYVIGST